MSDGLQVKGLEFKAAWREVVNDPAAPSHKTLADLLDVSYAQFMAYGDPSIDQCVPSHKLPKTLRLVPHNHALVSYLAAQQNAVVVALPKPGDADQCRLPDVHAEMGVWLRKHADAIRDGRITQAEAAEYGDIARRLQACIAAQVLYFERQSVAAPNVTPMRRGGAA